MNMNPDRLKIAYIGGGSRGWAWGLMSDLAMVEDMHGEVYLYDIDYEAAKNNETIGNKIKDNKDAVNEWKYKAVKTIDEALVDADFVVVSILPGTFDEMASDVHTPEKYGIYQSVGDTTGPGGIIRALRTIPMFEHIANAVKNNCPEAWVINYTNPMTLCVKAMYDTFPEIKCFGCCHEVFGTQKFLLNVLKEINGVENAERQDIKANVIGVNHFTWLTSAKYKNIDIFDSYRKFCEIYKDNGYSEQSDDNWMNNNFRSEDKVKMDLFVKYGVIAAAGDRHLAEFCPGKWYLSNPDRVKEMHFGLTTVDWRKNDLAARLEKSRKLLSGELDFEIAETGEEGVQQMRALLGLCDLVTNVNIPNRGQIPNLPVGAVVETNAVFRSDSLEPVFAGEIPDSIYPLISRVVAVQEMVAKAAKTRDLELAFTAFINDPLVTIDIDNAKRLYTEMIYNTRPYLGEYNII